MEKTTKLLPNCISEETAFIIENYPYGFTLKTKQKRWIEYKPNFGYRSCTRTLNPKNNSWCAIKKGTYNQFLVLAQNLTNEHIVSLGFYNFYETEKVKSFLEKYKADLLPEQINFLESKVNSMDKAKQIQEEIKQEVINRPTLTIDNLKPDQIYAENEINKLTENAKMYSATLRFNGIAPRCRKADSHYIKLGYILTNTDETLIENLKTASKETLAKYKAILKPRLEVCPVEYQAPQDSGFYGFKQTLFDSRTKSYSLEA